MTMNRIRLLSEQVANQIAAGEVVERPASVVKELVENSVDAEASAIEVEVQAGGRSLIRVTDNGIGMSRDDALLCLERHATSKISKAEDLVAIATMGFRGEAIPTIASVSRMVLTTREREGSGLEGTQVVIHGGKLIDVRVAGPAPGTSVEVRQLFFNLPARRKFLRSDEVEKAHIQHYLTLAALAYPEIAFRFSHDGRESWRFPALEKAAETRGFLANLRERMGSIYGRDLPLLEVAFEKAWPDPEVEVEAGSGAELNPFRVWGFIGAPGVSRGNREDQHIFVNRRPVENRGINFALLEGYHTALMKGRYPVCCLFLEIDPAEVDVNIHPAKREVKFRHEQRVRALVVEAVREALLEFHSESAGPASFDADAPPLPEVAPDRHPASLNFPETAAAPVTAGEAARPATTFPPAGRLEGPWPPRSTPPEPRSENGPAPPAAADPPLLAVPLRLVGVVNKLYIVLESDRGLVLMDQHAAHERVLFEQMLRRLDQGEAPSQRLLLAETVELSARDAEFLREQLPHLTRLGVGLSEFGERTFLLDALPPFVKTADSRRFVIEVIDELKQAGQSMNSWRLGEQTIAKTVCRQAVKANDPLSNPELERLLGDLRLCAMPYTCPHGRPTLIEINQRELEKKFGRTC